MDDRFRLTYGAVRRLLVALPALLFLASVAMAVQSRQFESSISAYYGGPLRDLFVGVLVATAACLLAYRGESLVERYNLQGAAAYLVVVALVPTGLDGILDDLRAGAALSPDGVTPAQYVWGLRFGLTFTILLVAVVFWRRFRSGTLRTADRLGRAFVVVTLGVLAAFLALALWQLWWPPADEVTLPGVQVFGVRATIHDLAAIFFISALVVAVWSHAWPRAAARRGGHRVGADELATQGRYRAILALMAAGPLVAWGVSALVAPEHFVLLLEWWEIVWFCVFWVSETRRLEPRSRPGAARTA